MADSDLDEGLAQCDGHTVLAISSRVIQAGLDSRRVTGGVISAAQA